MKTLTSKIKIDGTKYRVTAFSFQVRIDRSSNNTGSIELPVKIIHSSGLSPKEPVFWLAGGPGVSNMKQKPSKKLLESHDFVLVGYRGVDGSVRLQSKKIKKAVKGINNSLLSDESLRNLHDSTDAYMQELESAKIDLKNYTIIDAIDDLEDVRISLGYSKINLLSASYGTRVALLYSYRYPDSIHRSVMVGVNPPGYFIWWPDQTEKIIAKYDSIESAGSPDSNRISIKKSIEKSFDKMPPRWTVFKLDAGKIKASSFVLMYRKQSAVMVFDAYRKAALKGDYSGLYLMQLAYDYLVPGMFAWGDLFNKGASADFNRDQNYQETLKPPESGIGAPLSLLIWGGGEKWPNNLIEEEYRKVRHSFTETLMIGGNLDISTPPENASRELLPQMPNAKQIILEDMAHVDDLMYLQKDNFDRLVSEYFDTGRAEGVLFRKDPVSFNIPVSFNGIAKALYPIVLILRLLDR